MTFSAGFTPSLLGPLRAQVAGTGIPFPKAKAWLFHPASPTIFYLAVGSPLDQAGERFLLSAHMIQHQLLIYPAAVLFLLGIPDWLIAPITDRPNLRRLLGLLTHPLCCGTVYTLVLSIWHVPAIYDWALQDKVVHVIEHIMFFIAALFYWWPILSPARRFPPAFCGPHSYLVGGDNRHDAAFLIFGFFRLDPLPYLRVRTAAL